LMNSRAGLVPIALSSLISLISAKPTLTGPCASPRARSGRCAR
jgi:hypothetical protein